ncbi:MAG: hypothetical protein AB7F86_19105 [Bdellovibrionales bacterium]
METKMDHLSHKWLWLILLILGPPPTYADGCGPVDIRSLANKYPNLSDCYLEWERATNCCNQGTPEPCGYLPTHQADAIQLQTQGAVGAIGQSLKRAVALTNQAENAQATCKAHIKKAFANCYDNQGKGRSLNPLQQSDDQTFSREIQSWLNRRIACWKLQSESAFNTMKDGVDAYRRIAGAENGDIVYNCIHSSVQGEAMSNCFLLDASQNSSTIVTGRDQNQLPVTSAQTIGPGDSGCSALVIPGQTITASHCHPNTHTLSTVDSNGDRLDYKAQNRIALPNKWESGELDRHALPPEGSDPTDLVSHNIPEASGKPVMFLGLNRADPNAGCEISGTDNRILSCGANVIAKYQGIPSNVQGYPWNSQGRPEIQLPYDTNAGQGVFVARGPGYFNPNNHRFVVNAVTEPGMSGGPVYLNAGVNFGGFKLSTPLVIGQLSGVSEIGQPWNLGIIPVPFADQWEQILIPRVANSTLVQGGELFK